MIVYARKEGTYIWSDNNGSHKAGKVPLHTPLFTSGEYPSGWYALNERPANLSLSPQPSYPHYWVKVGDTLAGLPEEFEPIPEPPVILAPGGVTDAEAIAAIFMLFKWFKQ